jgi:hypothetical protein
MSITNDSASWPSLSHEQKNHQLFLTQKGTPGQFLKTGAIFQAQHGKSLHDLIKKRGETEEQQERK